MKIEVIVRGLLAGILLGLAMLVPGISGGTMLLVAGVYPQSIEAISKLVALRPSRSGAGLLVMLAASALAVILLLAGPVKGLVVNHRWQMYSIFIGLTLGGVPIVWKLLGRPSARSVCGTAAGLALMVATALVPQTPDATATVSHAGLFVGGVAAFSAMLLPGLSGAYLLVLTGQYTPILGAFEELRSAIAGAGGLQWSALIGPATTIAPFALGALVVLVGVTRLIDYALKSHKSLTLGFLLGLLLGSVAGIWPFSDGSAGLSLPQPSHALVSLCLAGLGFLTVALLARLADRLEYSEAQG